MTPIVLVTSDIRVSDKFVWHCVMDGYLHPLAAIGATPLLLPDLGDVLDLGALLQRIDGVLATGSRSNVHPRRYRAEATPAHEPFDEARDGTTLPLIRRAIADGIPLLAICRGMQELNVALGGTLVAELRGPDGKLTHRLETFDDPEELFGFAHEARFEADSRLAGIVGKRAVRVNSAHRQGIDQLAPGLVVEARAADGTIEAVRVSDARAFAYGVQWHPEAWVDHDRPSAAIFAAFGDAVRGRAEGVAAAAE